MSQHRFLVTHAQLVAEELVLQGEEFRHLKVRRLQPGEAVVLIDGAGAERTAVVTAIRRDRALLRSTSTVRTAPRSSLRLTLAPALLKADKLDLVVEKATELGAESIILLACDRVVAGMSPARLARLRRLARSAAKQSQSAHVPEISEPTSLSGLFEATADAEHLLLWEESDTPLRAVAGSIMSPGRLVVLIGPEGGFTRSEVETATAAGCHIASLGPRILRAETAAIAALTLCQYLWG